MKRIGIAEGPEAGAAEALLDGRSVYLCECEASEEELEAFRTSASDWIFRRQGRQNFLSRTDSGEDAEGWYCGYFEPLMERAIFDQGKLMGFCLSRGYIRYDGNSRSSFDIEDWGYPGCALSDCLRPEDIHIFLLADENTHQWKDWTLLKREGGKEYLSSLDF